MNSTADWADIGTLRKPGIWATYITLNTIGVYLCIRLMLKIIKGNDSVGYIRQLTNIFILGLCSGCVCMSFACGLQCLICIIHGEFYGGHQACWWQALIHVSSAAVQFTCVAFLSLFFYLTIVKKFIWPAKKLKWFIFITWVCCTSVTFGLSFISPLYLVSNGTYCLYEFKSPAILGWLVPCLLIALIVMIFSYISIYYYVKNISMAIKDYRMSVSNTDEPHIKQAYRSTLYTLVLFIGWIMIAITAIYESTYGTATQELVTAVGIGSTWHSMAVPLVYRYTDNSNETCLHITVAGSTLRSNVGPKSVKVSPAPSPQDTPPDKATVARRFSAELKVYDTELAPSRAN